MDDIANLSFSTLLELEQVYQIFSAFATGHKSCALERVSILCYSVARNHFRS